MFSYEGTEFSSPLFDIAEGEIVAGYIVVFAGGGRRYEGASEMELIYICFDRMRFFHVVLYGGFDF